MSWDQLCAELATAVRRFRDHGLIIKLGGIDDPVPTVLYPVGGDGLGPTPAPYTAFANQSIAPGETPDGPHDTWDAPGGTQGVLPGGALLKFDHESIVGGVERVTLWMPASGAADSASVSLNVNGTSESQDLSPLPSGNVIWMTATFDNGGSGWSGPITQLEIDQIQFDIPIPDNVQFYGPIILEAY